MLLEFPPVVVCDCCVDCGEFEVVGVGVGGDGDGDGGSGDE